MQIESLGMAVYFVISSHSLGMQHQLDLFSCPGCLGMPQVAPHSVNTVHSGMLFGQSPTLLS